MTIQLDAAPQLLAHRAPAVAAPDRPAPGPSQDLSLLTLSDADLQELFRTRTRGWAEKITALEASWARSGDHSPAHLRRTVDRMRDALRAAMWTQHRWDSWTID